MSEYTFHLFVNSVVRVRESLAGSIADLALEELALLASSSSSGLPVSSEHERSDPGADTRPDMGAETRGLGTRPAEGPSGDYRQGPGSRGRWAWRD
jgi:hypothetical protein